MTAVITATITAVGGIVCQLIIASTSRKEVRQTQADSQKLIEYKIDKLAERVDKHNNLIERTYKLEEKAEIMDEKMKVANHRIEDLERTGAK